MRMLEVRLHCGPGRDVRVVRSQVGMLRRTNHQVHRRHRLHPPPPLLRHRHLYPNEGKERFPERKSTNI